MKLTELPPTWYCGFWATVLVAVVLAQVWLPQLQQRRYFTTVVMLAALGWAWLTLLTRRIS